MPTLVVGNREIEYVVRHSSRARRKRIEVTPDQVRVIVPGATRSEEVEDFVRSKRRWIHDRTEIVGEEARRLRAQPIGYHSGAKVLFRGRLLRLRVEPGDVDEPRLRYRTAFHVTVPHRMPDRDREGAVSGLLKDWFRDRLEEDAWHFVRKHGHPNGLRPRDVLIRKLETLWGSCGKDRSLRLDEKLVRLPKPILEYVVLHELCHLRHRDHSEEFWSLLREILPDSERRKRWLDRHGVALL